MLFGAGVYYICVCVPVCMYSEHGLSLYVGETVCMKRRACKHVTCILCPSGTTQQPFYGFIRDGCTDEFDIATCLDEWIFTPVRKADGDAYIRKASECVLIKKIGTLNPSRCYEVNALLGGRSPHVLGNRGRRPRVLENRAFKTHRPLKRLRKCNVRPGAVVSSQRPQLELTSKCPVLLNRHPRSGLQVIAAALGGHSFPGSGYAAAAAWGLASGRWMYVFCRIDRYEDGSRRNRGLSMLRRISRHRLDLAPPILQIHYYLI